MKRIQFGWLLAAGPYGEMSPDSYMASVQKGLALIKGHFDSFWFVDHMQYGSYPLLEGWTALTYFAALHPEFDFGHIVLCAFIATPGAFRSWRWLLVFGFTTSHLLIRLIFESCVKRI